MKAISVIKKNLEFNRDLSCLLDTLKNISVAQFKALEKKITTFKELFNLVENFFNIDQVQKINNLFLQPRDESQLVVAVTSDKGLLGGLNKQIVGTAIGQFQKMPGKMIVIGERGRSYAEGRGIPLVFIPGIDDENCYNQALQLRDLILNEFYGGSFGYFKIIYPRPISFTVHRVEIMYLLPYILPVSKDSNPSLMSEIIMESNFNDIVEYLVSVMLGQRIYEVFGLSRLSEFAARFVHLEESSQKLQEMDGKIKLEYFRACHEKVDCTMRELFAGRLLYAK